MIKNKFKKIAVGVLSIGLIATTSIPSIGIGGQEGKKVSLEFNNKAIAKQGQVDYNKVERHYNVRVYKDTEKNEIAFSNSLGRPFIALNRTFVPYRVICEELGAEVSWNNEQRKVTAKNENSTVELFIGNPRYKVNGKNKIMDVQPFILAKESRTYIPARYIAEGLDFKIDFAKSKDNKEMYIVIFTENQNKSEMDYVLDKLANKGEREDGAPPVVSKPDNGGTGGNQFTPVDTIPRADKGTYRIEKIPTGNHYIIDEDFEGLWEAEDYEIYKQTKYINSWADVFRIYPSYKYQVEHEDSSITVKCTSHPELNFLKYRDSDRYLNQVGPSMQYLLCGQGYKIPIEKGMTLEFKVHNGDKFTVTI